MIEPADGTAFMYLVPDYEMQISLAVAATAVAVAKPDHRIE